MKKILAGGKKLIPSNEEFILICFHNELYELLRLKNDGTDSC